MKKILIIFCFTLTQITVSQNSAKTADLKSAEVANSPTLSLLDNTSAIIVSNPDCKDLSVNTENLSNISFEGTLNKGKLSGLEYYGLGNSTEEFRRVTCNKFLRPLVSGVLNKNDSVSNLAIGLSTNVVTIYRSNKQKMTEAYNNMGVSTLKLQKKAEKIMARDYPTLDKFNPATANEYNLQYNKVMDSLPNDKADEFAEILKKPVLMLDVSTAYSVLYPDNKYNKSKPDRFGVWSTLTVTPKLSGKDNYFNFYVFVRYLEDKSVYNKVNENYNDFFKYFDFGGKVQFDFNKLSVGYEYIKRNGDGKDYRSVGMIQYKVNDAVYLTGGFGKNFTSDSDKNLVTLFGIKWGINEKDSRDWKSNKPTP